MLKTLFSLFIFSFLLSQNDAALDKISSKIDTVITYQKQLVHETHYKPLEGKRFGIEVNPAYLITYDKHHTFTGGFSLFDTDNQVEYAFPIGIYRQDKLKETILSVSARKFLGRTTNGFYFSAMARMAHLSGEYGTESIFSDMGSTGNKGTQTKFGLGFGIGYRLFSYNGLYWGVSLTYGRYFGNTHNQFYENDIIGPSADNEFFLDMELLKFGYAF